MKKILNDPNAYADETLAGMCRAHPDIYRVTGPENRVIARATKGPKGKVGIVSGGGSGHLPVFAGYVGAGLLDACAVGDVFASPSAEQMAEAIRIADAGAGVLRLYGNYGGDILNFDMAGDLVELDGIKTTTVLLADDVASAAPSERSKRRGVAGMVPVFKIAGAAAAAGNALEEVTAIAARASEACRTIGVALTPCTVPQVGKPTFNLGPDEMEIGMGIHGEPGVMRGKLATADRIADTMLDRLLADAPLKSGDRAFLLVNSLGATPVEELYILYRRIADRLASLSVTIVRPLVGRYATSMEMTGASITLMRLDDELERMLSAPARCAFWQT